MARQVIWTESALRGLAEAADYIGQDSPTYAASLTAGAFHVADSLIGFPERGRRVPEFSDSDVRELFVGSYRLIYRVAPDTIAIVAFVHGARDLKFPEGSSER